MKYGTSSRNEPATHRCAVRSLVSECRREPVKRQMIVIDARPSTNDDDAQTIKLNELASTPAINPTTPSRPIHPSEAQDSRRARRAARYQPASRLGAPGAADGESSSSSVVATTANTTRRQCWFEADGAARCDPGRSAPCRARGHSDSALLRGSPRPSESEPAGSPEGR